MRFAAEWTVRRKGAGYPVGDGAGRRRLHQDFAPFVLEAHGRLGASAQAVIKRFAHLRASALGLSVSADSVIRRRGSRCSSFSAIIK